MSRSKCFYDCITEYLQTWLVINYHKKMVSSSRRFARCSPKHQFIQTPLVPIRIGCINQRATFTRSHLLSTCIILWRVLNPIRPRLRAHTYNLCTGQNCVYVIQRRCRGLNTVRVPGERNKQSKGEFEPVGGV